MRGRCSASALRFVYFVFTHPHDTNTHPCRAVGCVCSVESIRAKFKDLDKSGDGKITHEDLTMAEEEAKAASN